MFGVRQSSWIPRAGRGHGLGRGIGGEVHGVMPAPHPQPVHGYSEIPDAPGARSGRREAGRIEGGWNRPGEIGGLVLVATR